MNPAGTMAIGVKKGKAVEVKSIEEHIGKFFQAAEKLLIHQGLNPAVLSMKIVSKKTR